VTVRIHHGDSREVLKTFADSSIDSIVTDPANLRLLCVSCNASKGAK
jgi:predicted methyltransferase